jgi:hypothetical protein
MSSLEYLGEAILPFLESLIIRTLLKDSSLK